MNSIQYFLAYFCYVHLPEVKSKVDQTPQNWTQRRKEVPLPHLINDTPPRPQPCYNFKALFSKFLNVILVWPKLHPILKLWGKSSTLAYIIPPLSPYNLARFHIWIIFKNSAFKSKYCQKLVLQSHYYYVLSQYFKS